MSELKTIVIKSRVDEKELQTYFKFVAPGAMHGRTVESLLGLQKIDIKSPWKVDLEYAENGEWNLTITKDPSR
jgi:hypothetical protein